MSEDEGIYALGILNPKDLSRTELISHRLCDICLYPCICPIILDVLSTKRNLPSDFQADDLEHNKMTKQGLPREYPVCCKICEGFSIRVHYSEHLDLVHQVLPV
jgi:hypothetical protein